MEDREESPPRTRKLTRRQLLIRAGFCSLPVAALLDTYWLEPKWVTVRRIRLTPDPTLRIVQFSDIHHQGDRAYLEKVGRLVNAQSPDLVCFTGDIVENTEHLPEALDILGGIASPMLGVPGNWEQWSSAPRDVIAACFESTGGRWLVNETTDAKGIQITGANTRSPKGETGTVASKRVLLTHYPTTADTVSGKPFDLILAGHSHGGQCRIPLYGAVIVPDRVGRYDRGLFKTPGGPLYVNPGIGTSIMRVRFLCRPEVTVIEL